MINVIIELENKVKLLESQNQNLLYQLKNETEVI